MPSSIGGGGDSSVPTNAGTTSSPMTTASTPTNTSNTGNTDRSSVQITNQRQVSRQQSGNGITERQARDISHDEAIKVLQDWAARNRDYVGGGKKTGAQTS